MVDLAGLFKFEMNLFNFNTSQSRPDMNSSGSALTFKFDFESGFDFILSGNMSGLPVIDSQFSALDWVKLIYSAVVLATGCVGNVSFIIYYLWLRHHAHVNSANEYLLAICIADLASLTLLFRNLLEDSKAATLSSNTGCRLTMFVDFSGRFLCTWFITAFSMERFLVVKSPLRTHRDIRTGRARIIIGIISLSGFAYNGWVLFGYRMESIGYSPDGALICAVAPKFVKYSDVSNCANLLVLFLAPFGTVVVANTLIAGKLRKRGHLFLRSYRSVATGVFSRGEGLQQAVTRTEAAASHRLFFASMLYCIFNSPHYIWRFCVIFLPQGHLPFEKLKMIDDSLQMLLSTQYSVHCLTYARVAMVLLRRFRRTREFFLRHFSAYSAHSTPVGGSPLVHQKYPGMVFSLRDIGSPSASPTKCSILDGDCSKPSTPRRNLGPAFFNRSNDNHVYASTSTL